MFPENANNQDTDPPAGFSRNYGKIHPPGGMTERPKVPVLKTGWVQAHVGSNPTPSAMSFRANKCTGEVPELADWARLLSECRG
jgi:hypothetical protein